MAQTRLPDPGQPFTSPAVRRLLQALFPVGVFSGFDVTVTGPEELEVAPGDLLLLDGVLYLEDATTKLLFTTPPVPTVYTVAAIHVETGLLGGSAAKLEILTGHLETVPDGVPVAYIDHPGVVALAQSMVTPVRKLMLPGLITDTQALERTNLVPPFADTVNAAVQGQATLAGADANGGVVYTAVTAGASAVQVAHVVAGLNTVLNVVVAGSQITINLGTNASGTAISTANQVVAAVTASAAAAALVAAEATGTGAGRAAAAGLTALAGGLAAAGANTSGAYVYDRAAGLTALRISVLGAAPLNESYVLVSQLRAGERPPKKLLITSNNPTGASLSFVLRGTDGAAVALTPASFGATAGWITSEIQVGAGAFTAGEPYILQVQATVPPGKNLVIGRIAIDTDPFA